MTVARLAFSLDAKLAREIRKSAGREPLSAWLADAAERKLRSEGLLRVVSDFERESGSFTEEELRAADERLRYPKRRSRGRAKAK
jgi:hypothetical protein